MMVDDPNDPLEQCPLQQSHMIRRSRMAVHLSKCVLATNPGSQMVPCMYDSTHWVQQPLLKYHMEHLCDKRELLYKYLFQPDTSSHPNPSPLAQKTELPPAEENWDDGPVTTYDPHLKASSEAVLRTICVAPKSKRREFRQQEVERFQELALQGKVGMNVSARSKGPPQEPIPLRQPRAEVSKVIGVGRGIVRQADRSNLAVGEVAKAPEAEIEQAMSQVQLEDFHQDSSDNESWVSIGRGRHKKKEFRELRRPERSLGCIVPNRDAVAVPRGRGKLPGT